ncbi:DUF2330 domain-containing protein [Candidatus Woesearchaeota archaeon]|nr:DUF2330 domain-containing protein [Candidatus Woesearchaeota archaeon]
MGFYEGTHVWVDEIFKDYHIRIISSQDISGLFSWLQSNSFQFSETDFSSHDQIATQIYYLAIKVSINSPLKQSSEYRTLLPPIAISFKTPVPYYPFHLTSTGSGPISLDLFSFSEHPIFTPNLQTVFSCRSEIASLQEFSPLFENEDWDFVRPLGSDNRYITRLNGIFPGNSSIPDFLFQLDHSNTLKGNWALSF